MPALVIGVAVLVAVAGVGIVLASHRDTAASPPAGNAVISGSSALVQPAMSSDGYTDSGGLTTPTTDPSEPTDDTSAQAALDNEVDRDKNSAEQLIGHWVPQLSSKRQGLVADGITYGYLQIWQNFEQLREKYPNVLLIWSGSYVNFTFTDFYVTVVSEAYPDGQSANQWCDDAGIDSDACYAELLSHTVGPNGTTMLRN